MSIGINTLKVLLVLVSVQIALGSNEHAVIPYQNNLTLNAIKYNVCAEWCHSPAPKEESVCQDTQYALDNDSPGDLPDEWKNLCLPRRKYLSLAKMIAGYNDTVPRMTFWYLLHPCVGVPEVDLLAFLSGPQSFQFAQIQFLHDVLWNDQERQQFANGVCRTETGSDSLYRKQLALAAIKNGDCTEWCQQPSVEKLIEWEEVQYALDHNRPKFFPREWKDVYIPRRKMLQLATLLVGYETFLIDDIMDWFYHHPSANVTDIRMLGFLTKPGANHRRELLQRYPIWTKIERTQFSHGLFYDQNHSTTIPYVEYMESIVGFVQMMNSSTGVILCGWGLNDDPVYEQCVFQDIDTANSLHQFLDTNVDYNKPVIPFFMVLLEQLWTSISVLGGKLYKFVLNPSVMFFVSGVNLLDSFFGDWWYEVFKLPLYALYVVYWVPLSYLGYWYFEFFHFLWNLCRHTIASYL